MYDNRRTRYLPPQPEIDIYQIIREAQTRWLRPVEVIEILRNYQKFRLNPVPPNKPPSGSLFLFDRKTLRFFRKDGHNWRKKKDGKTVREAHERLKAGSIDVLHCYYAHGEDNPNFQRRSYWMLEGAYEHIVLVHYREVTEGSRSSVYRSIQEAKENASQSSRPTGLGVTANSPGLSEPEVSGPYKSPEVVTTPLESEETDSADEQDDAEAPPAVDIPQSSLLQQVSGTAAAHMQHLVQPTSFTFTQPEQKPQLPSPTPPLNLSAVDFDDLLKNPDVYLNSSKPMSAAVTLDVADWNVLLENFRGTSSKVGVQDYKPSLDAATSTTSDNGRILSGTQTLQSLKAELQHMEVDGRQVSASQGGAIKREQHPAEFDCYKVVMHDAPLQKPEGSMLKKLDSFGRWMSREIGEDSQSSLLSGSSDHGPGYWTLADATLDEISSFSHEMQLDGGPGPSVPQDQQFTIGDFSPDWAFSSEETKVIVAGNFLKAAPNVTWHCMFGEVEVPAEIIYEGALRCKAPRHAPGRVPFYITRGNRLACSEIREFEYRAPAVNKDTTASDVSRIKIEQLQMRFAKHISLCPDQNDPGGYSCDQAQLSKIQGLTSNWSKQWADIEKHAEDSSPKEQVLEALLKQQLQKWLLCKLSSADGKGASLLDERGQCVLHLAAALGYDWALPGILAAGVGINFRDSHGWTALHWAAAYGRENVVSTLLAAGASPGLVTDPTPQYPAGRTPADLAASSGHKGMAGYLAEMSLTSHLTALTVKEKNASEIDTFSAVLAEENAVELVAEEGQNTEGDNEHTLLQGSLRAVRNAARAAALIHASFRQESFKRRQEKEGLEIVDDYEMSLNEIKAMASRQGHQRNERLNLAATKIQQKFRGWKGRKDFLLFRQRVVRIQAHVRGRQVRRKFNKLLWTVGIVEKAVLRWRRKGAGLRNFRALAAANKQAENSDEDEEVLRAGRKQKEAAVQKAVTRVQSMVRSAEAREQYQRLQDAVKHAAAGDAGDSNVGDEMHG